MLNLCTVTGICHLIFRGNPRGFQGSEASRRREVLPRQLPETGKFQAGHDDPPESHYTIAIKAILGKRFDKQRALSMVLG
jgi:hypothetical protein